jgi:hypothetical protein
MTRSERGFSRPWSGLLFQLNMLMSVCPLPGTQHLSRAFSDLPDIVADTPVPEDFDYFHELILYDEISRCGNAAGALRPRSIASRSRVTRASERRIDQRPGYRHKCALAFRGQASQGAPRHDTCLLADSHDLALG